MQSYTNKHQLWESDCVSLCVKVRELKWCLVKCSVISCFNLLCFCNQCAFLCIYNHNRSFTFSCLHSSTDRRFWCSSAGRGGSQSCKLCRSRSHSLQVHSGGLPPQAGAQHTSTGKGKETHTHTHRFIPVLTRDIACVTVSSLFQMYRLTLRTSKDSVSQRLCDLLSEQF